MPLFLAMVSVHIVNSKHIVWMVFKPKTRYVMWPEPPRQRLTHRSYTFWFRPYMVSRQILTLKSYKTNQNEDIFCLFELLYQYEWEITKSNLGFGVKQIGHWPWSAGSNGQVDPWYHQWIQCNGTTLVLGGLIGFRVVLDQFQAVSAQPGLYWVVVRPYETHY